VIRFEPRLNPRLLYGAGFGLFAVGALLLTRLSARDDWNALIPGLLIAVVGCAIAQIETILGAVAAVPLSLTTMASGTSAAFRQIGSSIGVALFGSIVTSRCIGALPGALQAAKVPAPVRGGILQGNRVTVNAAERLLPGLPVQVARAGAGRHPSGLRAGFPRRGGGGLVDPGDNDDRVGVAGQTHRPCGDHGSSARAHGSAGAATSVGAEARRCSA